MENTIQTVDCLEGEPSAKRCRNDVSGVQLSDLPDEILFDVISRLPLKEAGRTSILSPRWKDLWKHTTRLDFESESVLDALAIVDDENLLGVARARYGQWVNKVITACRAPTLLEFRICFDFESGSKFTLNSWLTFAFAHQVQRLEFDLVGHRESCAIRWESSEGNYDFPVAFLSEGGAGTSWSHSPSPDEVYVPRPPFNFESLRALIFKSVDVSSDVIEYVLRHCPSLEELAVWASWTLKDLEISGPSLKLKRLEIRNCEMLLSLKVSNVNLRSICIVRSSFGRYSFENLRKLVELSITSAPSNFFFDVSPMILSCQSQLEVLTLCGWKPKEIAKLHDFPAFTKVKKLALRFWADRNNNLLGVVCLAKAAPSLQEFDVELLWSDPCKTEKQVEKPAGFSHQFLKVLKISGYCGRTSELELIRYFLENAPALEKVIVDPRKVYKTRKPVPCDEMLNEVYRRASTKEQLEGEVPEHIELVVL